MDLAEKVPLTINGNPTSYVKLGIGSEVLLLLTGGMGTIRTDLDAIFSTFDKDTFTLYAWDVCRYEPTVNTDKLARIDRFYHADVDYLSQFIEAANIKGCHVFGWCYGAALALILAARYPQLVSKIVTLGARAFIKEENLAYVKEFRTLDRWSIRMRENALKDFTAEEFSVGLRNFLDAYPLYCERTKGQIYPEGVLKQISNPVLIIHGNEDTFVPTSQADELHKQIAGSSVLIIPNGRHDAHMTCGDIFRNAVKEFLHTPI